MKSKLETEPINITLKARLLTRPGPVAAHTKAPNPAMNKSANIPAELTIMRWRLSGKAQVAVVST